MMIDIADIFPRNDGNGDYASADGGPDLEDTWPRARNKPARAATAVSTAYNSCVEYELEWRDGALELVQNLAI
jgi:hypothetical protein